jgi:hypothetical protein
LCTCMAWRHMAECRYRSMLLDEAVGPLRAPVAFSPELPEYGGWQGRIILKCILRKQSMLIGTDVFGSGASYIKGREFRDQPSYFWLHMDFLEWSYSLAIG